LLGRDGINLYFGQLFYFQFRRDVLILWLMGFLVASCHNNGVKLRSNHRHGLRLNFKVVFEVAHARLTGCFTIVLELKGAKVIFERVFKSATLLFETDDVLLSVAATLRRRTSHHEPGDSLPVTAVVFKCFQKVAVLHLTPPTLISPPTCFV